MRCIIDFVMCFSEIYFYAPLCSLWDKQLPHVSSIQHQTNHVPQQGSCQGSLSHEKSASTRNFKSPLYPSSSFIL